MLFAEVTESQRDDSAEDPLRRGEREGDCRKHVRQRDDSAEDPLRPDGISVGVLAQLSARRLGRGSIETRWSVVMAVGVNRQRDDSAEDPLRRTILGALP